MSAAADQANFPTMIIPRGTEIKLNNHGQLSIKTPGNLVIQNSGNYSELESTNGSIRIEENVSVEAVSVRAGQACFIQGTLTAWKVHAKRITLEDRAKAFIMVQESEHLDLAKTARLVGNFANEKELYLMMGKFTTQLRELPGFAGYYLIEAGNGVLSSFGLFETSEQADESKNLVTKWINDENFTSLIPNPPKITSGKVVAQSNRVPALV